MPISIEGNKSISNFKYNGNKSIFYWLHVIKPFYIYSISFIKYSNLLSLKTFLNLQKNNIVSWKKIRFGNNYLIQITIRQIINFEYKQLK